MIDLAKQLNKSHRASADGWLINHVVLVFVAQVKSLTFAASVAKDSQLPAHSTLTEESILARSRIVSIAFAFNCSHHEMWLINYYSLFLSPCFRDARFLLLLQNVMFAANDSRPAPIFTTIEWLT